ncbi:MAG TPA: plastocyanin/azurin family copper-binding protein [Polyangiaceae bacterium]|jgi:azurin
MFVSTSYRGSALSLLILLASCSKGVSGQPEATAAATVAPLAAPIASVPTPVLIAPPAPASAAPSGTKVELTIGTVASTMAFDKTTLTVPAGAQIHLVIKNAMPGMLAHNWVLVKAGTEAAVAAAGLAKGPTANYIDPGPDVLAYTPLAAPGKDAEVMFAAPAAGSYPYICSFPGHYMVMKGTLTVTP